MTANFKYNGYTLVEMLVVMSIFVVIGAIGFSSFYGMRDAISLGEEILDIQQDFRYAQRSALFLERGVDERWIYGIGIDLTNLVSSHEYRVFKWCSPFYDYGDIRTRGVIPNLDPTLDASQTNGNLTTLGKYTSTSCSTGLNISELVRNDRMGVNQISENFNISLPSSNNVAGDVGESPVYILFESVSGRAFFYDALGRIVNYTSTKSLVANPADLQIYIESPRTKVRRIVEISNISGKINVQTQNL